MVARSTSQSVPMHSALSSVPQAPTAQTHQASLQVHSVLQEYRCSKDLLVYGDEPESPLLSVRRFSVPHHLLVANGFPLPTGHIRQSSTRPLVASPVVYRNYSSSESNISSPGCFDDQPCPECPGAFASRDILGMLTSLQEPASQLGWVSGAHAGALESALKLQLSLEPGMKLAAWDEAHPPL